MGEPGRTFESYQFKPGQSGNPKGGKPRAPRRSLESRFIALLNKRDAVDATTGDEVLGSDKLAEVFFNRMLEGDRDFWALALRFMPATFLPAISADEIAAAAAAPQIPASLESRRAQWREFVRIIDATRYQLQQSTTPPAKGNGAAKPNGKGDPTQ